MEGMGSAVQLVTSQLSFASVVTLLRGTAVSTELTSWSKTNQEGKTGSSHPQTQHRTTELGLNPRSLHHQTTQYSPSCPKVCGLHVNPNRCTMRGLGGRRGGVLKSANVTQ